jgi:N-acetylneuraminate lyase
MVLSMQKYKGIFPALLTPFTKQGDVNTRVLGELIDLNLQRGVNGFYVGGSTSEAFLLDDNERKLVYKTTAEKVSGKATLIAHIGCISTDKTIEFGKYAKDCGYDAISAIAPFYYKFSFEQIKKHYYSIVEAVDLPMIIYNFPNFSGVNLSVSQVSEFLRDERFIGIKHTSNDYFALSQFKCAFPQKVVLNGFDEMFLAGLSMGADGGIGSTYNFMAEKFIKIQKLYKANKNEEAYALQCEANNIISVLCKVGVMEGEKEVLCQMGLDFGDARAPFSRLTVQQKKLITDEIMPMVAKL